MFFPDAETNLSGGDLTEGRSKPDSEVRVQSSAFESHFTFISFKPDFCTSSRVHSVRGFTSKLPGRCALQGGRGEARKQGMRKGGRGEVRHRAGDTRPHPRLTTLRWRLRQGFDHDCHTRSWRGPRKIGFSLGSLWSIRYRSVRRSTSVRLPYQITDIKTEVGVRGFFF